jgi:hypothetical protein
MIDRRLVVIGCGAAKLDERAPAAELYTGQHFRACLLTARALVPDERIRILSARHGLVGLADELDPYDVRMGQAGCITADELARQVVELDELNSQVLALCGAAYVAVLRRVFGIVITPLAGLGIGRQRHELAVMRARAASS